MRVKESQTESKRAKSAEESPRDPIVAMGAHVLGPVRMHCSVFIEDGW